eukprot:31327-Pelagococcus_subviridis.AAC.2
MTSSLDMTSELGTLAAPLPLDSANAPPFDRRTPTRSGYASARSTPASSSRSPRRKENTGPTGSPSPTPGAHHGSASSRPSRAMRFKVLRRGGAVDLVADVAVKRVARTRRAAAAAAGRSTGGLRSARSLRGGLNAAARGFPPLRRALQTFLPTARELRPDRHPHRPRRRFNPRRRRRRPPPSPRRRRLARARGRRPPPAAVRAPQRPHARSHVHGNVAPPQHVPIPQRRRELTREPRALRPSPRGEQRHPRVPRVQRQPRHPRALPRDASARGVDRAEARQERPRGGHLPRGRRVQPRQRRGVVHAPRREVQRERRQVRARDLRRRVRRERRVRELAPEAVARPGGDAAGAAAALVRAGERNFDDVETRRPLVGVESRRSAQTAVDHDSHARDRQRALRDRRRDDDAADAGRRGRERVGLLGLRQAAVERHHAELFAAAAVAQVANDAVDLSRAGEKTQDVAAVGSGVLR